MHHVRHIRKLSDKREPTGFNRVARRLKSQTDTGLSNVSRENPSWHLRRFEAQRFGLHSTLTKEGGGS
jgi:hypothetical protein